MHSLIPQRPRSSLHHHSSVGSLDAEIVPSQRPQQISLLSSIEFVYRSLRQHIKDKKWLFEQQEVKEMYRAVSSLMKQWPKIGQANEDKLVALRKQIEKIKSEKDRQIAKILGEHEDERKLAEEERRIMESDRNQHILDMSAEFTRKEQSYKQLLSGFMQSLTRSQKIYTSTLSSLNHRLITLSKQLSLHLSANDQQKQIAEMVNRMLEQMRLRRQNSRIQEVDEDEDSKLFEDEDEEQPGEQQDLVGPIEHDFVVPAANSNASMSSALDALLHPLVLIGFFLPCNSKNIAHLQALSSALPHCRDLLLHPKYPAILEMMRLELGEQQASMADEGSVIMRNIQHVDELSIRE